MDRKILGEEWRQEAEQMQNELSTLLFKFQRYSTEMTAQLAEAQLQQEQAQAKLAEVQEKLAQAQAEIQDLKHQLTEVEEPIDQASTPMAAEELPFQEPVVTSSTSFAPKTESAPVAAKAKAVECHDLRRIQDLRKAIGLNDRFRFKHDLFSENDALMWETIDALNAMETLSQANAYLKEHFSWNAEDETVVYFYEMLGRKFYR